MTVYDEVILGAAQLRRQIKFSGGLKMDEFGCTDNTGEAYDRKTSSPYYLVKNYLPKPHTAKCNRGARRWIFLIGLRGAARKMKRQSLWRTHQRGLMSRGLSRSLNGPTRVKKAKLFGVQNAAKKPAFSILGGHHCRAKVAAQ